MKKVEVRRKKQKKKEAARITWQDCLGHRKDMGRPLKESERAEYQALVGRDQRVARRKFFFPDKLTAAGRVSDEVEAEEKAAVRDACGAVGHLAPNDTDLPRPSDDKGKMIEAWCKQGSWGTCSKCHSMQPRPLTPMDLKRVNKPTIAPSQCTACKKGEYVPQPEHVPEALRNLKPRVLEALRPLDRDMGFVERVPHGYQVHSAMMAFAWKEISVQDAIRDLKRRSDRAAARAALECLLRNKRSDYKEILSMHQEFLDKYGDGAPLQKRKRPLRFIETEGLECCLWPQLYWHRNMCETVARASHENRATARAAAARKRASDSASSEEEQEDEAEEEQLEEEDGQGDFVDDGTEDSPNIVEEEHGHIKRGFIRKVLSPVIGYGADYELLHFVFDLSMWTTIGTKKNLAARTGVALRHLLKGSPWTPQYWRVRHHAVLDMQKQCGNATLFRTRAPYERSFPYHEWVMHEQHVLGRPRQHLAGAETLHMAWVLQQLDKGYICGDKYNNDRAGRNWKGHVLGPEDENNSAGTVVAHVTRLEFQDGKRKQATQKYHGRGTVHSHSLDFLENIPAIGLERKLQATVPAKAAHPFLHGLVMDSQCDYKDSKLSVREEPSTYDTENQRVLLQHTQEDKDLHVRTYMKQTMEITKCHEDVQLADGNDRRNGAHLRYVATYDMKFSSSIDSEWLNGEGSDYSTAVGVLRRLRVLEPEMWLTLAQERFPQASLSGTMLDIMAPNFENLEEKKPKFVEVYEESSWRREDMSLLEFLRKSNAAGGIIRYLVEKHKQHVMQEVQQQTGEDDKAFAKTRQDLLRRWKQHKKDMKDADEDYLELSEFLAQEEEGYEGLTSLTDFANQYKTRGEKLIAATTNSMLNDRYYAQWLALNKPFRRLEDFQEQAPEVMEKVNVKYRNFALCLHHAPKFWYHDEAIQEQMELEAHSTAFVNTILNKARAHRHIVQRYLDGEIPVEEVADGSVDSAASAVRADGKVEKHKLTESQKRLAKAMSEQMRTSLAACKAQTDEELEDCVAKAVSNKILFASGPPGTGKTHVVHEQICQWKRKGARILFTLPTGQLASEVRSVHPDIDVDTSHGAFLLLRPLQEAMAILTQYELVIIDEARGWVKFDIITYVCCSFVIQQHHELLLRMQVSMLTAPHFERILAMWKYADQLPCLVLLGDFWQLPVVEKDVARCDASEAWANHVKTITFREQVRCKCPALQHKLDILRTNQPSMKQLKKKILRGHRAWKTNDPTAYDILELFRRHDDTTIVTCSRQACAKANAIAVEAFFEHRRRRSIGTLAFDYESNLENYEGKGLKKIGPLKGAPTDVYKGMRIFLTKNLDKENDFVNGMSATIEHYDQHSHCLQVLTRTNQRLAVHMVCNELDDGRKVSCFPVRTGYASTIPKIQGMTLPHITIWLDSINCRAAAYVAMSRVKTDKDYLIAGGPLTPKHLVPAQ